MLRGRGGGRERARDGKENGIRENRFSKKMGRVIKRKFKGK